MTARCHLLTIGALCVLFVCGCPGYGQQPRLDTLTAIRRMTLAQETETAEKYSTMCMQAATIAHRLGDLDLAAELMDKAHVKSRSTFDIYAKSFVSLHLRMGQFEKAWAILDKTSMLVHQKDGYLITLLTAEPKFSVVAANHILTKIVSPDIRRSGELRVVVQAELKNSELIERSKQLLKERAVGVAPSVDVVWYIALAARLRDKQMFDQLLREMVSLDSVEVVTPACCRLLSRIGEFEYALAIVHEMTEIESCKGTVGMALVDITRDISRFTPSNSNQLFESVFEIVSSSGENLESGEIAELLFLNGNRRFAESFLNITSADFRFRALAAKQCVLIENGREEAAHACLDEMATNLDVYGPKMFLPAQIRCALQTSTAFHARGRVEEGRKWADRAKEIANRFPNGGQDAWGHTRSGAWVMIAEAANTTQRNDLYEIAWSNIVKTIDAGGGGLSAWGESTFVGQEMMSRMARIALKRVGPIETVKLLKHATEDEIVSFQIVAYEVGMHCESITLLSQAVSAYPHPRRKEFFIAAIMGFVNGQDLSCE